jgi:integrase/recombinase XerD
MSVGASTVPYMDRPLLSPMMLRAEFARWMLDDRGLAAETRRGYREKTDQAERYMLATFGRRLIRCQEDHIRAYLGTFSWSKTRNCHRSVLKAYFRFALERSYRKTNPMANIIRLPEPKYLPRPIPVKDVKRLRAASATLSLRHRLVVDLGLFAGLRRTEIARLRWTDVDLGKKRLRVFGKGRKEGMVPLHDELVAEFSLWGLTTPSEEWVFPAVDRRRPLSGHTIAMLFRQVCERAGIRPVPHAMRHSFATELLDKGADIRHVQELLRHASISSTAVYTKVSIGRLEEDVARLDFGSGDG